MMAELDLLTEESRFRALMENTEDSIYFKDRDCRLLGVSQRMAVNLGFSDPSELVGKTDIDLFGESFGRRTLMEDLKIMESGEPIIGIVESRVLEGSALNWTSTTKVPIRDGSGNVIGLMGITREINELKRAEMDLQHLATHDQLTDLPNRYLLMDRMAQTIAHAARGRSIFAVLFLDIDDFKATNDQYGMSSATRPPVDRADAPRAPSGAATPSRGSGGRIRDRPRDAGRPLDANPWPTRSWRTWRSRSPCSATR